MDPIVNVEGLAYAHERAGHTQQILSDLTLEVMPGKLVVLTGPSGAGKSTLLTIIGGLRRAKVGSVEVFGEQIVGSRERKLIRLRRQIGYAVAAEMLLAGEDLPARRAYELGLVNHVVPDGQALSKAKEIANRIASNGPLAVQGILATLRETECLPEEQAFGIEMGHGMKVMSSKDAVEGPRAFLEKRPPVFTGE